MATRPRRDIQDVGTLRAQSRLRVMEVFLRHGEMARTDICTLAELSQATVSEVTGELLNEGLLVEKPTVPPPGRLASRGRPRLLLDINGAAGLVVGVKMATHQATISVTDFKGGPISSCNVPLVAESETLEGAADMVANGITRLLTDAGRGMDEVIGVGVGMPGFVQSLTGRTTWSPIFGERGSAFPATLARRLNKPVAAENDVNLVALAERWFGHGGDVENFMLVTVEHGIGMGLYINGALYRGQQGIATEFGHMIHEQNGRTCRCGRHGCVEAYSADYAIVALAAEADHRAPPHGSVAVHEAILDITKQAHSGNLAYARIFANAGDILGRAAANVACVLTPERIIVTGEGMRAGELMMGPFVKAFRENALNFFRDTTSIVWHEWGDEVWARGAAVLILLERFAGHRLAAAEELSASI
ncbi:ROK family protein [Methylovirgula sp. 4M-Z18]|uniref:ROK family protein n=1 Tax=Methylovirgula sp. 4M-Z18 TaxID=2293567 RepID=UPI0013144081|nr:ROK family protein [Methylovirgula sp. 4M-Z18]